MAGLQPLPPGLQARFKIEEAGESEPEMLTPVPEAIRLRATKIVLARIALARIALAQIVLAQIVLARMGVGRGATVPIATAQVEGVPVQGGDGRVALRVAIDVVVGEIQVAVAAKAETRELTGVDRIEVPAVAAPAATVLGREAVVPPVAAKAAEVVVAHQHAAQKWAIGGR